MLPIERESYIDPTPVASTNLSIEDMVMERGGAASAYATSFITVDVVIIATCGSNLAKSHVASVANF